ncbi:hypothetical protein NP233_g1093 [Leucocoprinus birnbaumii]|uniref:C2H2-type domain-containing protein n=1 Tax=Leucocoprinus birnbaumii TaxID=56174 RepID=A0AAD5W3I2_9AGAR|nr:hypothetical protein NP233_g1093 [Leucocoprinus birnbaumii]
MRIFIYVVALILVFLMPKQPKSTSHKFSCVRPCVKGYGKASGLAHHQATCPHVHNCHSRHAERLSQSKDSRATLKEASLARLPPQIQASSPSKSFQGQLASRHQSFLNTPTPSPVQPNPAPPALHSLPPRTPEPVKTTSSGRRVRLPGHYHDHLPEPPRPASPSIEGSQTAIEEETITSTIRRVILIVWDQLRTPPNSFGLWRKYPKRPSFDPDRQLKPEDLVNHGRLSSTSSHGSALDVPSNPKSPQQSSKPPFWPFLNQTVHLLMSWLNNGATSKSEEETNRLVKDCILSPNFCVDDLVGFDTHCENCRLDREVSKSDSLAQFTESSVNIPIPTGSRETQNVTHPVPGFLHRKLTDVIREAFNDHLAHKLHYTPFHHFYQASNKDGQPHNERVYGEAYSSDKCISEYKHIQQHGENPPDDANCKREKGIALLMFSSDATSLADFGNATAWPIYMMLGNLSKYDRAQPRSGAMHHIAYIPKIPDSFINIIAKINKSFRPNRPGPMMAHCRRELMHAMWRMLLDDDFVHAYRYGMVIQCIDGIERRIYPRIFSYSADYPEKALLATIRDKGTFPCPRCLVKKDEMDKLGQASDNQTRFAKIQKYLATRVASARRAIYELGMSFQSMSVCLNLDEVSATPMVNAFVERLGNSFNLSDMLPVDLLHEIELAGNSLAAQLDERYRQVPTFGRSGSGIRQFFANSSEMKQMAARDYKDLLLCAIPCFEGLLPEPHNKRLMTLLYRLAEWHALAKLRMHTEGSLNLLQSLTREIGTLFRQFREKSCSCFETTELPREAAARQRRKASSQNPSANSHSRLKRLNLNLVKFHFMGDYFSHIRWFGTTDSYTTQLAEQSHRQVKQLYGLTNKQKPAHQIGARYIRQRVLHKAKEEELEEIHKDSQLFAQHHIIPHNLDEPIDMYSFVSNNPDDPAKKNFIQKLREHILGRIMSRPFDGDMHDDFSNADRNTIRIRNGRIYRHRTFRVNYTTYDVRRDHNTLFTRNQPFCMVPTPAAVLAEDPKAHPFWHAQVLGLFHAEVQHIGSKSSDLTWKIVEFLWVRWLGEEHHEDYGSGRNIARLPKVSFIEDLDVQSEDSGIEDSYAFSFLDPSLVVRAAHLIPAFSGGRTSRLLPYQGRTEARGDEEKDDWVNYYVNIFADCDMFMRHLGLGVGHQHCTAASASLPILADPQDNPPSREGEDYEMENDTAVLSLPVDVDQNHGDMDDEDMLNISDINDSEDAEDDEDDTDSGDFRDEDSYGDM